MKTNGNSKQLKDQKRKIFHQSTVSLTQFPFELRRSRINVQEAYSFRKIREITEKFVKTGKIFDKKKIEKIFKI